MTRTATILGSVRTLRWLVQDDQANCARWKGGSAEARNDMFLEWGSFEDCNCLKHASRKRNSKGYNQIGGENTGGRCCCLLAVVFQVKVPR